MKSVLYYCNDGKEKRQSHEIHVTRVVSNSAIEGYFDGVALGASKEEAINEAKDMVSRIISELQNIKWEELNK